MKNKYSLLVLVFMLLSSAAFAQYNKAQRTVPPDAASYLKIGTQIPFQHSLIYDHRITEGFSINGGIGLVGTPYTGMRLSSLENRNLISANDKTIIDRSFRSGMSYQIGANMHFNRNYVRVFGQLLNLKADLALTDLANLYFDTNIPPFANFLNPIEVRSNVPMAGALFGRRFPIGQRSEIHAEVSVSKTLGHSTRYTTGTFIDNIEIVNDIAYNELDNDLDDYFTKYGWVPSLNIYYVYKF
jgi:hypothetical protein